MEGGLHALPTFLRGTLGRKVHPADIYVSDWGTLIVYIPLPASLPPLAYLRRRVVDAVCAKVADHRFRAFFLFFHQAGRPDLSEDVRGVPIDEHRARSRVVGRSGANRRRHNSRRLLIPRDMLVFVQPPYPFICYTKYTGNDGKANYRFRTSVTALDWLVG